MTSNGLATSKKVCNGMTAMESDRIHRSQGCLLGQLSGDALGSLVEFQTPEEIRGRYPDGVRIMADGGTWNTLAGQPTDDSEMALLLARMLVEKRTYDPTEAHRRYKCWIESEPFDCGSTIFAGLMGCLSHASQANGALMRISPLGIFGANFEIKRVAEWAMQDAAITHPHVICQQANALFVMGIAHAIRSGCSARELYSRIAQWAADISVEPVLLDTIKQAAEVPPKDYVHQQGWVLIALQNALYQLLHAPSFEEGVVDTVMRGGDTDTNAAICGALLGAVYGREAVPDQWQDSVMNCRAKSGDPRVLKPRPECFWPVDALELAKELVYFGGGRSPEFLK